MSSSDVNVLRRTDAASAASNFHEIDGDQTLAAAY